jgi:hypothetical protein
MAYKGLTLMPAMIYPLATFKATLALAGVALGIK